MAVILKELGRLVRIVVPGFQYFQPRRRCALARCRLLVVSLLLAYGVLQVAWTSFPFWDGESPVNEPERARRVFDGGIKLDFDAPLRKESPTNSPSRIEKEHGEVNALDAKENPLDSSWIFRKGSNNSNTRASRIPTYDSWCSGQSTWATSKDQNTTEPKYFLTAVLLVRIYDYDPAKLTTREMMQWLQYLNYAGVQHVYVYDAYLYSNESQQKVLGCFERNGYVTYVDWSHRAKPKYTISGTQVAAYQDCLNKYGREFVWQTAIDIDEYPFCPGDHEPGFLARAVRDLAKTKPKVGEISMQNYLYLGKPLNKTVHPVLIDRLWRRTLKPANALVKPIYQAKVIAAANVHHNSLRHGYINFSPKAERLRMSHFWGARLQNWGEDTPKILNMTMEDRGMERAVSAIKPCLEGCENGCC